MILNHLRSIKGILKQYLGIIVQDDLLVEEGVKQETTHLDRENENEGDYEI